jgi:hypothetical protein
MDAQHETGLFLLNLTNNPAIGGLSVKFHLTVNMPARRAQGLAVFSQPVNPPIDARFEVAGPVIFATVMPPGHSKIRIDLSGHGCEGMLLLDTKWNDGTFTGEFFANGQWHKVETKAVQG